MGRWLQIQGVGEAGQAAFGGCRCRATAVGDIFFQLAGEYPQQAGPAFGFEIKPRDQVFTSQYRQAIVAVSALSGRFVDFQHLFKAEQLTHPVAVPQQWIERR